MVGGYGAGTSQPFAGMQNGVVFGTQAGAVPGWGAQQTSSWGVAQQPASTQNFTHPGMPSGGGQFNAFQGLCRHGCFLSLRAVNYHVLSRISYCMDLLSYLFKSFLTDYSIYCQYIICNRFNI